tara:strand:- start:23482 stop:23739 length:258 start_codon:yes stop_codon:yes gene_type:complete
MKVFLFFLGSLIRWPALKPRDFFYFHCYILSVYAATYIAASISSNVSSLVFTVGLVAPIMLAIYNGLPLDCLNYESMKNREINLL